MPAVTAQEEVATAFDKAEFYASEATTRLGQFVQGLQDTLYSNSAIELTWETPLMPELPTVPAAPVLDAIVFQEQEKPQAQYLAEPNINISDFTEEAPTITLPAPPTVTYGDVPTVPTIGTVSLPSAPTLTMPDVPVYLGINTITFGGVDLHEDWLQKLEDIPTLELVRPTPYSYQRGPDYASSLLDSIKARLQARINGGTGLAPAVEQALWDRARDRETAMAMANKSEILRASGAMGFQLPSGVLAAQLREADQAYYGKLSDLSRDIANKQADLEQSNLKEAITEGIALESQLMDQTNKVEALAFEISKAYADNGVQIYNASVDAYKALLQGYETYASAYKTVIDSELAKVEVYKSQLEAERTKAQVNTSLVEQYKAQIDASMSQVAIFNAQVDAAKTLVQLEEAKIGAAAEQIKAYVARVNAETSKVEAYKTQVQAASVEVDMYATKAKAYEAKVGAQSERARAEVTRYQSLIQAKNAEWDGYRARVAAESSRVEALAKQSGAKIDAYRAEIDAIRAVADVQTTVWKATIEQYAASKQYALETAKANRDALQESQQARLEASKVGAQVYAQLVASAYGMINASASISASESLSASV